MKIVLVFFAERPLTDDRIRIGRHRCRLSLRFRRGRRAARLMPDSSLSNGKHRPPAWRADPLIVLRIASVHFVAVAQLTLDSYQILDVQARAERMTAASTACMLFARADILIETDPKLCRSLKYVKELAERQP